MSIEISDVGEVTALAFDISRFQGSSEARGIYVQGLVVALLNDTVVVYSSRKLQDQSSSPVTAATIDL